VPKIICAIDTPYFNRAYTTIKRIASYIDIVKLGLEFFTSCGISGVERISKLGVPIFLDLKLHDIPNTVKKTVEVIKRLQGIEMLTIHITGGAEMIAQTKSILKNTPIKLLGVSLLTSLSAEDLKNFGITSNVDNYVKNLALFGKKSGLDGVVCSAYEANLVKEHCGKDFLVITPGITGNNSNDHKRSISVADIKKYNIDYVVIGRLITENNDTKLLSEIRSQITMS
jgi:orotidine-5'-phosphate decarboxylase